MDGQAVNLPPEEAGSASKHGRRGAARARLALPARLTTCAGTQPCMILNASVTGAQIGCETPPAKGVMAVIDFPPIEFFGSVAWVRTTRFGMRFEEPLPYDLIVELRYKADRYERAERCRLLQLAQDFVSGRD